MADLITNNSTLREARRRFILTTKRYDLLTNADISANVDNGANRYLQEASTWLDLNVRHQRDQRKEVRTLAADGTIINIGDLISVDSLFLISEDARIDLTEVYIPYKEFMAQIHTPISEWESGAPQGWTIIPHVLAPPATRRGLPATTNKDAFSATDQNSSTTRRLPVFHNHVGNGDFHSQFNYWELGAGWAINPTTGKLVGTAVAIGEAAMATDPSNPPANNMFRGYRVKPNVLYRVQATVVASVGTVLIKVGDTTVAALQGSGTVDAIIRTAADFGTDPADGEIFSVEADDTFTGTVDDIIVTEVDGETATFETNVILIYPPADVDYTVELIGTFHSELLTEDTQWSIWTRFYMDLLVKKAAQFYYEEMGNSARAALFDTACYKHINGIDDRNVDFELIGFDGELDR